MNLDKLRKRLATHGLALEPKGPGHFHITGGPFLVNFWPDTKHGPRLHVAGTIGAQPANRHNLIYAALTGLPGTGMARRHRNPKYYRRVRRELLADNPRCYLCGCDVTYQTATVDHLIPLEKGGSNGRDNLRLACHKCNQVKGAKMPRRKQAGV